MKGVLEMNKLSWVMVVLLAFIVGCSNDKQIDHTQVQSQKVDLVTEALTNIEVSTRVNNESADLDDQFLQLAGVIQDQGGTLYLSDQKKHLIYRIGPDSKVETMIDYSNEVDEFNQPIGGFKNGPLKQAQFNSPNGLAIDANNNLYIADSGNGMVRKLTQTGEVETIVDGLSYPFDLVINESDELFISDALSHQIYRLMPDGRLDIFAGGGYLEEDGYLIGAYQDDQGEAAQFNEPSGLALTPSGNLLVADTGNQRIRMIEPDGTVSTVAGSGDVFIPGTPYVNGGYHDGLVEEAQFNFPKSIVALSDDEFIVSDTYNHALRLIQNGEVTTLAGTGDIGYLEGDQSVARFYNPTALIHADDRLIIIDQYNHAIREVQFTTE